jgi:hypothetical protein
VSWGVIPLDTQRELRRSDGTPKVATDGTELDAAGGHGQVDELLAQNFTGFRDVAQRHHRSAVAEQRAYLTETT